MFGVDVVDVRHLGGQRLEVVFADGLRAVLDLTQIIQRFEGVFAPLRDSNYCAQVRVDPELGTLVWPNGADICPDVLYSFASGRPIVAAGQRVLN